MSQNRVALVTGASRGIGRAIALRLCRAGHQVVGTATTPAGQEAILQYLNDHGYNEAQALCLDVNCDQSVKSCFSTMKSTIGMPEILVNNAAITKDNVGLRMKEAEWSDVIDTNLNSVFRLSKLALKSMFRARWGRVINLSSVVALMGNVGQCNYAASKAGMHAMSKSLAKEVASFGITINCVSPGFVDTDMAQAVDDKVKAQMMEWIPMRRMATPEEVAHVVAFLASEESSYITGENINVNGGMLMS